MLSKSICNLIYEEKTQHDNIEHVKESIKYSEMNIYSSRYYSTLTNNNIRLAKMIKIRDVHNKDYNNGILKYVEIAGVRYVVSKVSVVTGRYITVDLREL